jgi:hypothetical protein
MAVAFHIATLATAGGLVVATDDVLHFSYFLAVRAVHRLAGGAAVRMAMLALPASASTVDVASIAIDVAIAVV